MSEMTTEIKTAVVRPDAGRLVEGLRDTGYTFTTAVADVVDNSIAADATKVDISVMIDVSGDLVLYIADDGVGMDGETIERAMRYGAPVRQNQASLGKFGLGLKTASTAFCRCLSVVSRDGTGDVVKARWDLDHIVDRNEWELLLPAPEPDELEILDETAGEGTGTVVVWERVDRVLGKFKQPQGGHAKNALKRVVEQLDQHLGLVFQRFLDHEDERAPNVAITLNGAPVAAWDPFVTHEIETTLVSTMDPTVEKDGEDVSFSVRAYVLPAKGQFSDKEAERDARISNDRQGVYIYRENRLIESASWLGMFRKEPHFSLMRVEFSFDHRLDEAFSVDIKKSQITLNEGLHDWLKSEFLPAPRRAAEQRYRGKQRETVTKGSSNAHGQSNANISAHEAEARLSNVVVKDEAREIVEVTNERGTHEIKLALSTARQPGEISVQTVDSLDDGLLWQPTLIDGHHGVQINSGHPYYHKVYVPNYRSNAVVQGIDSLLWSLAEAELGVLDEKTRTVFDDLRYEVSRILRKLVEDLPDPNLDELVEDND
jgi:hypothetical protein